MSKKTTKSTEEIARHFRVTIPGDRSEPERYHRALDRVYGPTPHPASETAQASAVKKKRG